VGRAGVERVLCQRVLGERDARERVGQQDGDGDSKQTHGQSRSGIGQVNQNLISAAAPAPPGSSAGAMPVSCGLLPLAMVPPPDFFLLTMYTAINATPIPVSTPPPTIPAIPSALPVLSLPSRSDGQ